MALVLVQVSLFKQLKNYIVWGCLHSISQIVVVLQKMFKHFPYLFLCYPFWDPNINYNEGNDLNNMNFSLWLKYWHFWCSSSSEKKIFKDILVDPILSLFCNDLPVKNSCILYFNNLHPPFQEGCFIQSLVNLKFSPVVLEKSNMKSLLTDGQPDG